VVRVCPTSAAERRGLLKRPCYKVFFESPDGAFRGIAAMTVRRDQLIINIIGGEKNLQYGRCLVVESLKSGFESFDIEFFIDGVICFDPFRGGPIFHGDDFSLVAVINIADHDILVSFAGYHR
jgi:hypothetical protein